MFPHFVTILSIKFFKWTLTNRIISANIAELVFAGVAQLVEQLICNQQVGGSSPSTSSKQNRFNSYGGVPEWPKGTDCKSAGYAFGGSNPPAPTKTCFIVSVIQVFSFYYKNNPNQNTQILCTGWDLLFMAQLRFGQMRSFGQQLAQSFPSPLQTGPAKSRLFP